MSKYIKSTVFVAGDELIEQINLFNYMSNNMDGKIKQKVRPIMVKAKKLAKQEVLNKSWSNPRSFYSWKLKVHGGSGYLRQHGRYAKSLYVKDHSKPYDVMYEVTGKKKEYRLTHLIEHPHRIKLHGKFLPIKTKAINHIEISQDLVDKEAPKACEEVLDKLLNK